MIAFIIILRYSQNYNKGLAQPLRAELFKKTFTREKGGKR